MVEGTSAQAGGRSIRELERLRDDYLVAIQQVLRQFDIGAGATLKALETRLYDEAAARAPAAAPDGLVTVTGIAVRPEWIDYNGHLTDHRYLHLFGDAHDVLWRKAGVNEAYRAGGRAFFTAESHVRHLAEVRQSDTLGVSMQIVGLDAKRLHVYSRMRRADGSVAATAEHMYLHVDTKAGKTAPMAPEVLARFEAVRAAQAGLPRPADAGRAIGMQA
jgi:carnitine 3-dehydrogenase